MTFRFERCSTQTPIKGVKHKVGNIVSVKNTPEIARDPRKCRIYKGKTIGNIVAGNSENIRELNKNLSRFGILSPDPPVSRAYQIILI